MPPKLLYAIRILPPFARTLVEQVQQLLGAYNGLASGLNGRGSTNLDVAGSMALLEEPTALTIASGVIDVSRGTGSLITSQSSVQVDTESSAASDDLDTINGGRDGMILILRAANAARTVMVKNGTGNITLPTDVELNTDDKILVLRYNATKSAWLAPPWAGHIVPRTATAISYTVRDTDYYIGVTSTAAPRTITLPASVDGKLLIIKDETGAAATNNITIAAAGNIDGAATAVITTNYGAIRLIGDGTDWFTWSPHAHDGVDESGLLPLYARLAIEEIITALWNFNPHGTGGITEYDLAIGDTDGTPTYGILRMGDAIIGRTSYKVGAIDLDGAIIIRNNGGPVTGDIELIIVESTGGTCRLAIPKSGVGLATYHPRSFLMAGPAPADTDFVKVSYWQALGLFHNLLCDTAGDGADLGVQNDLEVEGDIFVDSIKQSTPDAGVTIASRLPPLTKTANYTATPADTGSVIFCNPSAGAFTIALPTAVGNGGIHYHIVNTSGSGKGVSVDPDGSETINELAQVVLGSHDAIHISADEEGNWQIL